MARLDIIGTDDLLSLFDDIAEIPSDVIADMLIAEGEVIAKEQRKAAAEMLQGPYYEGGVANAVTPGKPKITYDGGELEISFKGTQHGNRLAEIAFVNHYGAHGNPGRPFIDVGNARGEDEAAEAAAEVHGQWLDSKN